MPFWHALDLGLSPIICHGGFEPPIWGQYAWTGPHTAAFTVLFVSLGTAKRSAMCVTEASTARGGAVTER